MAKRPSSNFSTIVFWGALWGAFEATVGFMLHSLNIKIGWLIWFPVAFYFTNKVHSATNNKTSVLYTSAIAGTIKLVNLFMPTRLDKVINPAVSIFLEGLVIFVLLVLLEKKKEGYSYPNILTINIAWKSLYLIYILFMPEFFYQVSAWRGVGPFFQFLLWESILSSAVIFLGLKVLSFVRLKRQKKTYFLRNQKKERVFRIGLSLAMLVVALVLQWVL